MPTKQPMPPVPPLQPLLFWETGILLFIAGIVTARFPVPALTACALFAWVDSRMRRTLCCLLAAACVIAGWWIGEKSVPRVPQEYPAWLEKSLSSRRAVTVEGGDEEKALEQLMNYLDAHGGTPDDYRITVGYGYDEEEGKRLWMQTRAALRAKYPGAQCEVGLLQIGCTIAVHTGPYALGMGVMRRWKKQG